MENKYLYGEIENTVFIKAVGDATMKNSKTVSDIIDDLLTKEKKEIILDMSECTYVDSTFLGLIAKYAIEIKMKWNEVLHVMNPLTPVLQGLKETGIEKFINIIFNNKNGSDDIKEIEMKDFDNKNDKSLYILEMHKTLVNLNEENKKTFGNVVALMEQNISSNN